MLAIVGLIILLAAAIVAIAGGLSETNAGRPPTENFSVFGHHVTGSTGSSFLFGIVVGAVALLGLIMLLAGARHIAGRSRDAGREVARFQREMAFINRDSATRLESQQRTDDTSTATSDSYEGRRPHRRSPLLGRWSRIRQPVSTGQTNGHHRRSQ